MTNADLSQYVFQFLNKVQVETVVVCAGARNAPLVLALEEQKFKTYHFFEERSAAFFAIGLMKAYKKPVAVLTTSGTAAAELLPATIEAHYQSLPLILVTADRPVTYRSTGAPQSIEQIGLYKNYVEQEYDLDVQTQSFQFEWSEKKPIHLNVCFDEPLIDKKSVSHYEVVYKKLTPPKPALTPESGAKPLIVVGELDANTVEKVVEFITQTRAPVYAESLSQLRYRAEVAPYLIRSTDRMIRTLFVNQLCDSVIRIGAVPTLRFWRELELQFRQVPVTHYSKSEFSGLSRESQLLDISQLSVSHVFPVETLSFIKKLDAKLQSEKERLLHFFPLSEPAMVYRLSEKIGEQAVYLGNSLPIRHWDQFTQGHNRQVYANRGANGIDGQISTYLGWSENLNESYCVVGDLTALYDLAALGLTPALYDKKRFIVVINNFGGQIFKRVFKNDHFVNAHKVQFYHWAKMWNWSYLTVNDTQELGTLKSFNTPNVVVEMVPDAEQTEKFWNAWDQACQSL